MTSLAKNVSPLLFESGSLKMCLCRAFRLLLILASSGFIITSQGCSNAKEKEQIRIAKLQKTHKARLALIRDLPDPLLDKVADSMKRWIPVLQNVLADDQRHRITGMHSMTQAQINEQTRLDSNNLKIVCDYLDKYGWPKKFDVGFWGQRAVGACIQHAPLAVQEKYYPLLVSA